MGVGWPAMIVVYSMWDGLKSLLRNGWGSFFHTDPHKVYPDDDGITMKHFHIPGAKNRQIFENHHPPPKSHINTL